MAEEAAQLKQQLADKTEECSSLKNQLEELIKKVKDMGVDVKLDDAQALLGKLKGGSEDDGSKDEEKPAAEAAAAAAKDALGGKLGGLF